MPPKLVGDAIDSSRLLSTHTASTELIAAGLALPSTKWPSADTIQAILEKVRQVLRSQWYYPDNM